MNLLPRPVSIVALRGGFGNQLFAWAYGQGLRSHGHSVIYDPGNRLGRGFALRDLIPRRQLLPLPALFWRQIVKLVPSGPRFFRAMLLLEDQREPSVAPIAASAGFRFHWGYWQSSDYFQTVREEVFDSLVHWLNVDVRENLSECAIHVRRGDYVSDIGAASVMGTLPLNYYCRAIKRMKSVGYSKFVVYSDDRDWVKENLLPMDSSIEIAETDAAEDFAQMARSGALITANSSFSWWAAFLVSSLGGEVIAPREWFADSTMDSTRLIPDTWISL